VMKMAEPLTKFDRSLVALSIDVTVPGTRNLHQSHAPIGNLSCTNRLMSHVSWWGDERSPPQIHSGFTTLLPNRRVLGGVLVRLGL